MGKYEPLADHLRKLTQRRLPMKFEEIEEVLGFSLPPSSRKHRAWWSNNPSNNVMTYAWIDAGYRTEDVDIEQRKLVFRRAEPGGAEVAPVAPPPGSGGKQTLYGCLRGTVTFVGEVDLTEPADPEWGAHEHGDAAE
jgi:YD repeat-containing protein